MDIFYGIALKFLAFVVDHIGNLATLFADSNPYKWQPDEPIPVHTVYTKHDIDFAVFLGFRLKLLLGQEKTLIV